MFNRVSVRLEATFQKIKGHLADYETVDGNIISIYTLTPEEFIIEKTNTYLKRKKIRDLWDIFFLLKLVRNNLAVKAHINRLIKKFSSPIDEQDLKTSILEGISPSAEEMMEYIKRKWEATNT